MLSKSGSDSCSIESHMIKETPNHGQVCLDDNYVTTYVKQKKSVVEPTRKKVAADTGTYREGRRGLL